MSAQLLVGGVLKKKKKGSPTDVNESRRLPFVWSVKTMRLNVRAKRFYEIQNKSAINVTEVESLLWISQLG